MTWCLPLWRDRRHLVTCGRVVRRGKGLKIGEGNFGSSLSPSKVVLCAASAVGRPTTEGQGSWWLLCSIRRVGHNCFRLFLGVQCWTRLFLPLVYSCARMTGEFWRSLSKAVSSALLASASAATTSALLMLGLSRPAAAPAAASAVASLLHASIGCFRCWIVLGRHPVRRDGTGQDRRDPGPPPHTPRQDAGAGDPAGREGVGEDPARPGTVLLCREHGALAPQHQISAGATARSVPSVLCETGKQRRSPSSGPGPGPMSRNIYFLVGGGNEFCFVFVSPGDENEVHGRSQVGADVGVMGRPACSVSSFVLIFPGFFPLQESIKTPVQT